MILSAAAVCNDMFGYRLRYDTIRGQPLIVNVVRIFVFILFLFININA